MNLLAELTDNGPQTTSDLVAKWTASGVTADAARKRISRVRRPIRRLQNIGLAKREAILYLEEHRKDGRYFEAVPEILKRESASYGRAIRALEARGGCVHRATFPAITGAPVQRAKGQVPHEVIEQQLLEAKLLLVTETSEGEVIGLLGHDQIGPRRRAAVTVENIVLAMLKDWLTKLGASSAKATETRLEAVPIFGPYQWDLVGPSYLYPLVSHDENNKPTNGFAVADILLDKRITLHDLQPFFQKCNVAAHQGRRSKLMPIFVADHFAPAAFDEVRKRGILMARPDHIFGKEAAELLRELIRGIEHASALVAKDPEKMERMIQHLARLEGAMANSLGIVFEFLVARLTFLEGYNIEMRQIIRHQGESAEIDIKGVSPREVVCIEAKAKRPGSLVDAEEIIDWIDRPLPRIKGWLKMSESLPEAKRFEFWTSTDYTEDAKVLIATLKAKHKKQPIDFFNGEETRTRLSKWKQTGLVQVFNEQFHVR